MNKMYSFINEKWQKCYSIYYLHFLRNLWMHNSENRFYTEATYNKMKFREI